MAEVEVIEARMANNRRNRMINGGLSIERKRVAAYIRVSTDDEEQLQSFNSQKLYYEEKIANNKEWVLVGIYSDEAITGTKTVKRHGFLNMINDCNNNLIDVILTKSISRFSRNLVDTLQYVRMLKSQGIAVIFEKENINTLSMESEMALALLSTLAQNEVESLSANVKLGLKMKMKRGELLGFNGCLGYDYHPEDKSITINEREAETVRYIFEKYVEGYGTYTIANDLEHLNIKNKKGVAKWTTSGVMGIIKNEKYKGDLMLGKTFTVDPISKRRLANMGEEEKYYIKDHHEAIVDRDIWEKAREIRETRYKLSTTAVDGSRAKQTRKYAFSSKCECGFCGAFYTRRSHHQDTQHKKPVWKCRVATNKGKKYCPESKAIDEMIIENSFLDMFNLLANNYEDVFESVISSVEKSIEKNDNADKIDRINKSLSHMDAKRRKLTELLLDDKISKEAYDEKYNEYTYKISQLKEEKNLFESSIKTQADIRERMKVIRKKVLNIEKIEVFDRIVFESIVDKIIIGEEYEDGTSDPYKLTFVLKGMEGVAVPDSKKRYFDKRIVNG